MKILFHEFCKFYSGEFDLGAIVNEPDEDETAG